MDIQPALYAPKIALFAYNTKFTRIPIEKIKHSKKMLKNVQERAIYKI